MLDSSNTSRLSTASLLCAVIGLTPFLLLFGFPPALALCIFASPLGLILGILALLPRSPKPGRSKLRAITAVVISSLTLISACVAVWAISKAAQIAMISVCATNMQGLTQSLNQYASLNNGHYPPNFAPLILDGSITRGSVICKSSGDSIGPETTPADIAAHIMQHSSFIYIPPAQGSQSPPDTIILYEPLHNHAGQGMNIAHLDGSVQWHPVDEARSLLENQNLKLVE